MRGKFRNTGVEPVIEVDRGGLLKGNRLEEVEGVGFRLSIAS